MEDGLAVFPGSSIGKLIKVWEEKFGKLRSSTTPADSSIQMEDKSPCLVGPDVTFFRMAVGTCLYITRDRPDVAFTVKKLSSYMSSPTISAMRHLKKLVAYLKGTSNYAVVLQQPHGGQGLHKQTNDKYLLLESFSDSDWSSDKRNRCSTSSGLHMLCGNLVYSSSRTQRVISLSSCEAELHGMVSTLCDGIFIKRCAEFVIKGNVEHILLTDSSSAGQLCSRQGTGKVKHLSPKILDTRSSSTWGDCFEPNQHSFQCF